MQHPKDVGDQSTMAIMLALRLQGYDVFVPFGENTRYDLVIDERQLSAAGPVQDRSAPGWVL